MDNLNIDEHGNKFWYDSDDNLHRTDVPAVILSDGYQAWYQHGLRHRDNGPAIEWPDGEKSWYLNNRYLLFDDWLDEVNISDEDKVMMKLKYG
jgi:hypothetical protein